MAIQSSILAWEIPWTEEPGMLQSMSLYRVSHDLAHTQHYNRCLGYENGINILIHSLVQQLLLSAYYVSG